MFKKIVLMVFILLFSTNAVYAQTPTTVKNKFSFGVVNWLLKPKYQSGNNPQWYSDLKLDINLSYTGRDDNAGFFGGFYDLLNSYRNHIDSTLNFDDNTGKTTKMLERAKLIRPAYGQRSTYNAELSSDWMSKFPMYYSSELCYTYQKECLTFSN
ncbi:MAG: hypothetical protein MUE56_06535 [Ignavibacteria bacterium]|jgi:hypothetical protein|nr:hypothetical protein [Ignavibacteria bacterium]